MNADYSVLADCLCGGHSFMEKIPYSYSCNQTDSNPSTSTEDPTQSYSKVQAVTSEQLSVTSYELSPDQLSVGLVPDGTFHGSLL